MTNPTLAKIRTALENNNPDTVFHNQTNNEIFCMIPEMGYPFEVHITVNEDGSITDRCDEAVIVAATECQQ